MIKLNFEHPEQFKGLFETKSRKVTDGIVTGIREAMEDNKSTADLFEISLMIMICLTRYHFLKSNGLQLYSLA